MKKLTLALSIIVLVLSTFIFTSCDDNAIQSEDKNLADITIVENTLPEEIQLGKFDDAGIQLLLTYDDATTEQISVQSNMIPEKYQHYLTTVGVYNIELYYRGKSTTFQINMVDNISTVSVNFYALCESNNYSLVKTQDILKGESASAPSISENIYYDGIHYTFTGWDSSFTSVNSNINVYAQYSKTNYYTVIFYNANNEIISQQKIDEGKDATEPDENTRAMNGYDFVAWDRSYSNITHNISVYGLYIVINEEEISTPAKTEIHSISIDSEKRTLTITYSVCFNDHPYGIGLGLKNSSGITLVDSINNINVITPGTYTKTIDFSTQLLYMTLGGQYSLEINFWSSQSSYRIASDKYIFTYAD